MPRVFVDTNVLFPFSVMDLMLALTEDAIHEVLWTEALLAEWEEVIVQGHRRSPASAARITATIRECFAKGRVAETAYRDLIVEMPGRDPDDRQHMAAAVAGGASAIVTRNRRDFPADPLGRYGVRVLDPDAYLSDLIVELPHEVTETVIRMAAGKRRPPMSPGALADAFANAGVPTFAGRLMARLGDERAGRVAAPGVRSRGDELWRGVTRRTRG